MTNKNQLQSEIMAMFKRELELDIPSMDIDLIESGYLDSLSFVQLLAALEDKSGLKFDINDLELEHFVTVEKISELMERKMMMGISYEHKQL